MDWLRDASQNTLHSFVQENFAVVIASPTPRDSFRADVYFRFIHFHFCPYLPTLCDEQASAIFFARRGHLITSGIAVDKADSVIDLERL